MPNVRWFYCWWAYIDVFIEPEVAEFIRVVMWDKKSDEFIQLPNIHSGEDVSRPTERTALNNLTRKAWVAEHLRRYNESGDRESTERRR